MENKSNLSILLVDDEPFDLKLAITILSNLGYQRVETASNGNVALDRLSTSDAPYDIIICDLNMPEMDGLKFMRHANDRNFYGGMIFLSGEGKRMLGTVLGLSKSYKLNILGALEKPLNPAKLEIMLNNFEPISAEGDFFEPEGSITEAELRSGIMGSADNQLRLLYQPKVHVSSGEIREVETLARWWNMERGNLGPETFIPLAEQAGLIDELTNEIYRQGIVQVAEWAREGRDLRTAINFSVNSFSKPDFCNFLIDTAAKYKVSPQQIVLEISETQSMMIPVDCLEALMGMRLKRFGLSIDDFGTGNSSLAQLKNIPFTELKVDSAFVRGASQDASALAILETTISLAKKLDMDIVAEGAETREDWDLVERLGVDYIQGFYCAKPMCNEDLLEFLDNWTGPHRS